MDEPACPHCKKHEGFAELALKGPELEELAPRLLRRGQECENGILFSCLKCWEVSSYCPDSDTFVPIGTA